MNSTVNSIRVRVRPVEQDQEPIKRSSPREQFWALLKREKGYSESSISSLEIKLTREFGRHLHEHLVQKITQGIRDTEEALYGGKLENLLDDYRHFFHDHFFRGEKEGFPYYPYDPISKLIDFRQQVFREVPGIQAALNRLALTSDITFSVRIEGYTSLNFSVFVGQIEKLAQVFDFDFDSFLVFLEAFIPSAFGDVFGENISDQMMFDIDARYEAIRQVKKLFFCSFTF